MVKRSDQPAIHGTWAGVKAVFRHPKPLFSGASIGTLVGIVPGVGGTVASFLSYSFVAQSSRDNKNFGKGDIRGVIAPEAANNAKDGGSLIPTLAFGIPGSAEMALFLGVLVLHGMEPGPLLLLERESSIFVLILALLSATILASLVIVFAARYLINITFIDSAIIIPSVLTVSLVGAYALNNTMGDVVAAAVFGVIGYLMIRLDYPRITLVIALVLGGMMERNYIQSMLMFRDDPMGFVRNPSSLVLMILVALVLLTPLLAKLSKMMKRSAHVKNA